jgi:hypothetical protein
MHSGQGKSKVEGRKQNDGRTRLLGPYCWRNRQSLPVALLGNHSGGKPFELERLRFGSIIGG